MVDNSITNYNSSIDLQVRSCPTKPPSRNRAAALYRYTTATVECYEVDIWSPAATYIVVLWQPRARALRLSSNYGYGLKKITGLKVIPVKYLSIYSRSSFAPTHLLISFQYKQTRLLTWANMATPKRQRRSVNYPCRGDGACLDGMTEITKTFSPSSVFNSTGFMVVDAGP